MHRTRKPLEELAVDLLLDSLDEHRYNRSPQQYQRLSTLIPPLKQEPPPRYARAASSLAAFFQTSSCPPCRDIGRSRTLGKIKITTASAKDSAGCKTVPVASPGLAGTPGEHTAQCAAGPSPHHSVRLRSSMTGRKPLAVSSKVASVIGSLKRRGPALPGFR